MDIVEGSVVSWSHGHKYFPYIGKGTVGKVYMTKWGLAYDVIANGATSHVTPNHPYTPNAFVTLL